MKIVYAQNPLATVVELDDHDRQVMLLREEIVQLKYAVVGAKYHLKDYRPKFPFSLFSKRKGPNLKKAMQAVSVLDNKEKWNERNKSFVADYENELKGSHAGDCCCVACSCEKCHAESLLGIDTIPGLKKHEAALIGHTFYNNEGMLTTALQVIDHLKALPPVTATEDWHAPHIERWAQERVNAITWLEMYREKFLNE